MAMVISIQNLSKSKIKKQGVNHTNQIPSSDYIRFHVLLLDF